MICCNFALSLFTIKTTIFATFKFIQGNKPVITQTQNLNLHENFAIIWLVYIKISGTIAHNFKTAQNFKYAHNFHENFCIVPGIQTYTENYMYSFITLKHPKSQTLYP